MEIPYDSIIGLVGMLLGGGSLGAFFTWRWQRMKAKAEAKGAEVEVAQKVQDTYEEMLEAKQKEVEDNRRYIDELRQDRDHYKQGYLEVRNQLDQLSKDFRTFRNETEDERASMKRDIARNGRQLECMRPFLCGREDCALRLPVSISPDGEVKERRERKRQRKEENNEEQ